MGDLAQILQSVQPPFKVITANGRPVGDESIVAIECGAAHTHNYYISDIAAARPMKCPTCTFCPKPLKLTHALAEAALGQPLTLEGQRKNAIFVNHRLKLYLQVLRDGATSVETADYITIRMRHTASRQKVVDTLNCYLAGWPHIPTDTKARLVAVARPIEGDFEQDRLPYNIDYAEYICGNTRENVYIVQECLNLENYGS